MQELRVEKLSRSILALDIANSSDLAAVALSDLRIRVWKLESGEAVREFSFAPPESDKRLMLEDDVEPISLRFSPDGKILAVGILNAIHLYDVETWRETASLGVAGEDKRSPGLEVTPQRLEDLKVIPQRPGLKRRTAAEAQAEINKPEPSLNETVKAKFKSMQKGDGQTRILNFEFARNGSGILAAYCRGHCYFSTSTGRQWLSQTKENPVRLWNVHSASMVWERLYDPEKVMSQITISPDGNRFAAFESRFGRCAVGIYDLRDGHLLWSHGSGHYPDPPGPPDIRFLQDSQSFITNRVEEGDGKNKLWQQAAIYESSTGKKISDLPDRDGFGRIDITGDGREFISTTSEGHHLEIWDLETKKVVITKTIKERGLWLRLDRLRVSPDGRWLVVGNNKLGQLFIYKFSGN